VSLATRLGKLEAVYAARAAEPPPDPWWDRLPAPVTAYLLAQPPAVAEAFGRHLDWSLALPCNRDRFTYYQVLTRPWRAGEAHFLAPALLVWDAIFHQGGRVTTGQAQLRVLACGRANLFDALRDGGLAWEEAKGVAWARMAGGPLCDHAHCLCFHDRPFACRAPAVPAAAWRARGTTDPATLAALGFGAAERALLGAATDEGAGGDGA
jgi:hypothetical protein